MASNVRFLAFLKTSPLPLVHWGHTMTMCWAFCDGYPHWHLGSSTPGTFLRYRYALRPMCSLRIWMAILLWALVRFWWMADGVPLLFIRSLFVLSSVMMLAACQVSGSAGARCPKCVFGARLFQECSHCWKAAIFNISFCFFVSFSFPLTFLHSARSFLSFLARTIFLPHADSLMFSNACSLVCWAGGFSLDPAWWILLCFK